MAHKASTQSRQPSLSAAVICTSLQFFHLVFSISLSAVLLHVVHGLPHFRRRPSPHGSINGYWRIVGEKLTNYWGVTCDGLASHPRGVEILLAASCYRNWDKLRPDEPVDSKDFTHLGSKTIDKFLSDFANCTPNRGCHLIGGHLIGVRLWIVFDNNIHFSGTSMHLGNTGETQNLMKLCVKIILNT